MGLLVGLGSIVNGKGKALLVNSRGYGAAGRFRFNCKW